MKNIKSLLMLAAITVASMTFVSCDDDPWYDGCWHDPYDWSYNYGDWNWNNDYWNQGGNGNNQGGDERTAMAQTLCGDGVVRWIILISMRTVNRVAQMFIIRP